MLARQENAKGVEHLNDLGRFATALDEDPLSTKVKRKQVDFTTHIKGRYKDIRAAVQLLSHPYWERVWTVQEYSSPKPGVFLSYTSWMDKTVFMPALTLFMQSITMFAMAYESQGHDAFFVDGTLQHTRKKIKRFTLAYVRSDPSVIPAAFDAFQLLLRFRSLKSSDPRDKVYAPLAMSRSSRGQLKAIKVDYGMSVTELYT